jgi:effector-binding domain-containing protein
MLQHAYNEIMAYIQQKGLQQITSGYNVTVKDVLPGMSVDELIIDVYVGVSENLL